LRELRREQSAGVRILFVVWRRAGTELPVLQDCSGDELDALSALRFSAGFHHSSLTLTRTANSGKTAPNDCLTHA